MNNLDRARKIHHTLYGDPKSHAEWAANFNKVADIKKELDFASIRQTTVTLRELTGYGMMDIKAYLQFKKLKGGTISITELDKFVGGRRKMML